MAPITRTYLELDDPRELRPAPRPRIDGLEIDRVQPAEGATSRWFYLRIGERHKWTDHAEWSGAEWHAWAEGVETWVAAVRGERAGYYELRPDDGSVELAYLGLLPDFQGRGLGGYLLTHALERGLAIAPRVWVHTNTRDGAAALPNYEARGLRPFRTEAITG